MPERLCSPPYCKEPYPWRSDLPEVPHLGFYPERCSDETLHIWFWTLLC
jgi:hypothetical protein